VSPVQVVLSDLQDLQASWEEGEDQQQQLTAAEAAVVQQLTSSTPIMPDDFGRWGCRVSVGALVCVGGGECICLGGRGGPVLMHSPEHSNSGSSR
jgi:hypothetical protein